MELDFDRFYIWDKDKEFGSTASFYKDLTKNAKFKKLVFFCPEEYEIPNNYHGNSKLFESFDLTFIFCSTTYLKTHRNNFLIPESANIILWPTFWISRTYDSFKDKIFFKTNQLSKIDKLFISLNNRPHPHRCLMMDNLYYFNLLQHGHISWHDRDLNFIRYHWKYYKPKKMSLSDNYAENTDQYGDLPIEYYSTLINLIAESTIEIPLISEKTATAILFKKPFIVFGAKNFHKELKSLGFELYDELFDYTFDSVDNTNLRLRGIINNLNKLKNQDYEFLRKITIDKTEYNYQHMIKIATSKKYIPEFMINYIDLLKKNVSLQTNNDLMYLKLESNAFLP